MAESTMTIIGDALMLIAYVGDSMVGDLWRTT
jgi:hypothetical protein